MGYDDEPRCELCGVLLESWETGKLVRHAPDTRDCRLLRGDRLRESQDLVHVDGERSILLREEGVPITYAPVRARVDQPDQPFRFARGDKLAKAAVGAHAPRWAWLLVEIAHPGDVGEGKLVRRALRRAKVDPIFAGSLVAATALAGDDGRAVARQFIRDTVAGEGP